jgi:hypothetical protein
MGRVQEIEHEIALVSARLQALKQELETIRKSCDHEFVKDDYIRICKKCDLQESIYY